MTFPPWRCPAAKRAKIRCCFIFNIGLTYKTRRTAFFHCYDSSRLCSQIFWLVDADTSMALTFVIYIGSATLEAYWREEHANFAEAIVMKLSSRLVCFLYSQQSKNYKKLCKSCTLQVFEQRKKHHDGQLLHQLASGRTTGSPEYNFVWNNTIQPPRVAGRM